MRKNFSKGCLIQGSDTATCLRLSDVISLSLPLQDCIWECHCHTDTDSKSRWRRVKISKGCLVLGSDTATCLKALWCYNPVTPSIRLYLRLPLPHWHWFIEQKNESKISKQCLNQGSDTATCWGSLILYPCHTHYKSVFETAETATAILTLIHRAEEWK